MKTIICLGPGGVGKTTASAILGVHYASLGKKTLVLTIDPSQRLARSFNIETDGKLYPVYIGDKNFFVSVINHETAFEDFLRAGSQSKSDLEKILKNKLYLQLKSKLSGSQNFTALQTLLNHIKSNQFEYIILDTPPASHTLDFLDSPDKISVLFSENITKWFRSGQTAEIGFLQKFMNFGAQQMMKVLEKMTGSQFIGELALFFVAIRNWQQQLRTQSQEMKNLFYDKDTKFVLVTTPELAKLKDSEVILQELKERNLKVNDIILNKFYPTWWQDRDEELSKTVSSIKLEWERELKTRMAKSEEFIAKNNFTVEQVTRFKENENSDLNPQGLALFAKNLQGFK